MTSSALLPRTRGSGGNRIVFAFFTVPVILIGLLAMHVLTVGGMSEPGATQTMITHVVDDVSLHSTESGMPAAESQGLATTPENCTEMCGPSHEMLGMICILAFLVGIVLLILQLILIPWADVKRGGLVLVAKATVLVQPTPPSIYILSISRT